MGGFPASLPEVARILSLLFDVNTVIYQRLACEVKCCRIVAAKGLGESRNFSCQGLGTACCHEFLALVLGQVHKRSECP